MFVLSSPSGAGKTTISRMLLERDAQIRMSVSVTTRPKRPGEVEGRDYFFVSQDEYDLMVERGEFLEYATVFGNSYGTPKSQISDGLAAGQDFLFDIDWQGTQQLYLKMDRDVVRVFLLPPSLDELRRRLTARGTDSAEVIAARMARAQSEISHWDGQVLARAEYGVKEMSHWDGYDYVLINQDVDTCLDQVMTILKAERLRRSRQTGLIEFVRDLMRPEG
jgi:guanylate kinase